MGAIEAEYPAAHSMDTEWFAVDRDGRVAYLFSGENGPVPEGCRDVGDIEDLVNHLRAGMGQPPLPEDDWYLIQEEEYLASVGLFVFTYPDDSGLLDSYTRDFQPERPVHVDQLPPAFRDRCRTTQFPVSFAEATRLQPCEFVVCSLWGNHAGFVCSDGQTLRAFPGREEDFRGFWQDYRRSGWGSARKLRFEGEPPA